MPRSRLRLAYLACVAALAVGAVAPRSAVAAFTLETVVLTADVAPGTPGLVFDTFRMDPGWDFDDGPTIGIGGQVAFLARLAGSGVGLDNDTGVWAETGSGLVLVAREGNAAAGTADRIYSEFGFLPEVSAAGSISLRGATLAAPPNPPGGNQFATWAGPPGGLGLVVNNLDPVPTLPGVLFAAAGSPVQTAGGEVAFEGDLTGSPFEGMFFGAPGSFAPLALRGDPAPGTAHGFSTWNGANTTPEPLLGENGTVTFEGLLDDGAGTEGIWSRAPGQSLALLALEGDAAPGTQGGTFASSFFSIGVDASGVTVFSTFFSDPQGGGSGIFAGTPGSVQLLMREGDPAPGGGGGVFTTLELRSVRRNTAGEIAFLSQFSEGPVSPLALFVGPPASLRLVVRDVDHPPGTPASAIYFLRSRFSMDLDEAGNVAFLTELSGVSFTEDLAIFLVPAGGSPELVARKGGTLAVAPGDVRTVADLAMVNSIADRSRGRRALGDTGELVFRAEFMDGSEGIFVATVPEPAVWLAELCAAIVLVGVGRRRVGRPQRESRELESLPR